jgi:hypothetical protein
MSKRTRVLGDHIELDGERYVLLDATPEQVLRWLHKHHRTEAFAAIRLAVEEARYWDECATDWRDQGNEGGYVENKWRAHAVRMAIRAAIGSDKV